MHPLEFKKTCHIASDILHKATNLNRLPLPDKTR
jgi:hypothetical protein